jgi:F-type H+-transporting ATPase subunit gamma
MNDNTATLHRKIVNAEELKSVVHTMKIIASSNIGQYRKSVEALADYYRNVELALSLCLRESGQLPLSEEKNSQSNKRIIRSVVFGSDQGLVSQFNDVIADYAIKTLTDLSGKKQVWAVGERVYILLKEAGIPVMGLFPVPNSIKAVTPLVWKILIESEAQRKFDEVNELHLFYNRTSSVEGYAPVSQRILPLDEDWSKKLADLPWPGKNLPQIIGNGDANIRALIQEYLFVSIFRACAESLASENASRLASMQRADKNIDELLGELNSLFYRIRQSSIDEDLFDVISGFEALNVRK